MKKNLILLAGIALAVLVFFIIKTVVFYNKIYTPSILKPAQKEKTSYNILLFGYGGGKHEGAYLTDTIMVLHVNMKIRRAVLLSIPRDLWVKLPTKSGAPFHAKINTVYQFEIGDSVGIPISSYYPDLDQSHFGSQSDAEYTKFIMSQVLGVQLDNYVAIDFAGFTKAIDDLGGVDINVLKAFTDPQYPLTGKETDLCNSDIEAKFNLVKDYINNPNADQTQLKQLFDQHKSSDPNQDLKTFYENITNAPELAFPCRYETLHFDKGMQHMDGTIALKYVRSRHALEDGGDFGRAARQQQLLKAIKDKILNIGFIPKILPLLNTLGSHVKTDFSLSDIQKFIGLSNTAKDYTLTTYVISDQNLLKDSWSSDGQFILIPKGGMDQWRVLQQSIENIFNGIIPTPLPTATPSAALSTP